MKGLVKIIVFFSAVIMAGTLGPIGIFFFIVALLLIIKGLAE